MERPMPAKVRTRESIPGFIAAFSAMLCLAWTDGAQAQDDPLPPLPRENASSDARSEGRDSGEAAENQDFIETDRNSFTFARTTAGAGRMIVESSYSYLNFAGEKVKNSFPESLMRYGIGDRFELRLGWNYETGRERLPGEGDTAGFFSANAEQQIFYGFKAVLTRQKDWFPASAFYAQGHTPTGGPQGVSQLRAGYVVGWTLPNRWNFDSAIRFGTDKDHEGGYRLWAPSTVLKIPLTPSENWFTHVEYFGEFTQGKKSDTALNFVDVGLHHLFTPNIEVGGMVAFGPRDGGMNLVTNFGIGIRF
jgi:hypothetical protein